MGGADGCDGAIFSQSSQFFLVFKMSAEMPGQKTVLLAWACIDVVPWWAACNASRISLCNVGGMTVRSLYTTTPSAVQRSSRSL